MEREMQQFDDVVVGAGILGLSTASALVERGRRVVVVERASRTMGATVRNFGMLWPVGQPAGERRDLALRSRERWVDVLTRAGGWMNPCGSLHLAHEDDELDLLHAFVDAHQAGEGALMLTREQTLALSPLLVDRGLKGAMFSPTEICVDPRAVPGVLVDYLVSLGVQFLWNESVLGVDTGAVRTSSRLLGATDIWVCSGDEIGGLYGDWLRSTGAVRCKLQMLRTRSAMPVLGPMLAGGLTLAHYESFRQTTGHAELARRLRADWPDYFRWGIHVMASQHGDRSITLGDSHEYGDAIGVYDRTEIDDLILNYLRRFLPIADEVIEQRWAGYYLKHPTEPWLVMHPEERVHLITGVGGAGMTLSFGLTEKVVKDTLG